MECNKDEALRARAIAEKKFEEKDIAGAKKFALKAQNLFPALEGIVQLIATLDVYAASELKINGEKNLYALFSVPPSVDDDTLKKQYRKLALLLHPDKNKSIGAEGAFQFISEAWTVLSDKDKRFLFDQKIGSKGLQPRTYQSNNERSAPKAAGGVFNFPKNAVPKARAPKSTSTAPRSAANPRPCAPRPTAVATFWTSCLKCKTQYEYLRMYLNQKLMCPKCREPFLATESPFPGNRSNSSSVPVTGPSGFQQVPNPNAFSNPNFQWGPFSRTAGAASAAASSSAAAQAANVVHQTYEKVKRDREIAQQVRLQELVNRTLASKRSGSENLNMGLSGEEAQAAARFPRREEVLKKAPASKRKPVGSENLKMGSAGSVPYTEHPSFSKSSRPSKKRRGTGDDAGAEGRERNSIDGLSGSTFFKSSLYSSGMERVNGLSPNFFMSGVTTRQGAVVRMLSQLDSRKFLMQKGSNAVCNKLKEWDTIEERNTTEKEKAKITQKHNEAPKDDLKKAASLNHADQDVVNSKNSGAKVAVKKDLSNDESAESDDEVTEPVTMDVPDPDFHDFDKDRSESAFSGQQIWATYDEEDGMPRYYALVRDVISLKPFKIKMGFLTTKSNSEFGPLNWVDSGFTKTSGEFRIGKYEVKNTINIFSHKISWKKGPHGVIRILPSKGEIWALYRNWSMDWNEHTPDDVIYKYDMVEVLDDYNEDQGVSVAPLLKVAGFKTVYHRHLNPKEVKKIPREEMFRLSHQVPYIVLTGEEGHNAPKGCFELDPAATPVELLEVFTEAKDGEVITVAELGAVNDSCA